MTFEEFQKNEERHRLERAWHRLDPFQKFTLAAAARLFLLRACLTDRVYWGSLRLLNNHVARRRAKFIPSVHWVGR